MTDEEVPDADQVVDQIKSGDFDGQLVKLVEAVRTRFEHGTTRQKWRLDHDTLAVTEDDITLAESRLVERACGTSWGMLNPVSSAGECMAIIAACLHTREGKALKFTRDGPSGEAWDEAGLLTAAAAIGAISSYEVDRAPKA